MFAQVPSVPPVRAAAHAWHVPEHAVLQHTPAAQWPSAHCEPVVHAAPFALRVHLFDWHVPPVGQSPSALHSTQVPLPLQTAPPLSVHVVPLAAFAVPQQPVVHVFVTHEVVCAAHVDAAVHAVPPSHAVPVSGVPVSPEPVSRAPVSTIGTVVSIPASGAPVSFDGDVTSIPASTDGFASPVTVASIPLRGASGVCDASLNDDAASVGTQQT